VTIASLSTRLSLAQSMVSTAVSALREQGLVVTEIDSHDRRRVQVMPSRPLRSWAQTRLRLDLEVVLEPLLQEVPVDDRLSVIKAIGVLNESFRRREQEGTLVLSGSDSRARPESSLSEDRPAHRNGNPVASGGNR
jgi:DNA-binding transcriptional ArsR family regulator